MTRLYGVQYLRAIAALGVVVFHAAERNGSHFTIGAAGVDVPLTIYHEGVTFDVTLTSIDRMKLLKAPRLH